MLKQKSGELTWKILAQFKGKATTFDFTLIQPIILRFLESVYVQSRHDQKVGIKYTLLEDGSIYFDDPEPTSNVSGPLD